jgi:hypothetical protein
MPGPVCFHFYGDPVQYFTYPPEVNPFPGLKHCYETLSWPGKERMQRVTVNGLYLTPLHLGNIGMYKEYMQELADLHPAYEWYAHALEDRTEDDWMLPVGRLVALNHWGVLQVCILQCSAFRTCDNSHLAYRCCRMERQYACPQRAQLVEALADALFEYAYSCHTYAEMGSVRATMENALNNLEYVIYVFLTLRNREVLLSNSSLRGLHRSRLLDAYGLIRTLVSGVMQEDYARMSPADVRQFIGGGILDLLTHEEAMTLGFATAEESWPREHGGRMRTGGHLDWLETLNAHIYGTPGADRAAWRHKLYDKLVIALYQTFQCHGPTKYPKHARFHALADILSAVGLETGIVCDIANRLSKRLAKSRL